MFKASDYTVRQLIPSYQPGVDNIDWGMKAIGSKAVWEKTKGKGVKIAVLDTGISQNHIDLEGNIKGVADFTGSKYGVEDRIGHGSHVAGIIAAVQNDIGVVGISPESDIYAAKVLGDNGSGSFEAVIKGIRWAMEMDVDIITMSLGSASRPPEVLHDTIKQAVEQGIILIAATGNENSPICYPAAYDEVIAVSAVDQDLQRAKFSNHGIQNEISAPGVDIVSTYKDGTYARLSGTSMATPVIAGACAMLIARHKQIFFDLKPSVGKARQILSNMVVDLGDEGFDEMYGAGMIDLNKLP